MITSTNPAAVTNATFVHPANARTPEIANGNITSQVIANASAILDC
ncbi:MAG TPA: hypothetical protein VFJ51_12820 [Nitrososphaeraceae archaeon]|nr:hypothetical protein [Nitrososphaeraceae archaeon]